MRREAKDGPTADQKGCFTQNTVEEVTTKLQLAPKRKIDVMPDEA
jgi:hypothetical protein